MAKEVEATPQTASLLKLSIGSLELTTVDLSVVYVGENNALKARRSALLLPHVGRQGHRPVLRAETPVENARQMPTELLGDWRYGASRHRTAATSSFRAMSSGLRCFAGGERAGRGLGHRPIGRSEALQLHGSGDLNAGGK